MKRLLLVALVLLCSAVPAFSSSTAALKVEDIRIEPLAYSDPERSWFVVSCTVENQSEQSGNVAVTIRTIDHYAFERKPLYLTGYVRAGEKKTLSVLQVMDSKMFKSLRRFEVKSIELE